MDVSLTAKSNDCGIYEQFSEYISNSLKCLRTCGDSNIWSNINSTSNYMIVSLHELDWGKKRTGEAIGKKILRECSFSQVHKKLFRKTFQWLLFQVSKEFSHRLFEQFFFFFQNWIDQNMCSFEFNTGRDLNGFPLERDVCLVEKVSPWAEFQLGLILNPDYVCISIISLVENGRYLSQAGTATDIDMFSEKQLF